MTDLKKLSAQLVDFGFEKFIFINIRYFVNMLANPEVFCCEVERAGVSMSSSAPLFVGSPTNLSQKLETLFKNVASKDNNCLAFLTALKNSNNDVLLNFVHDKLITSSPTTPPPSPAISSSGVNNPFGLSLSPSPGNESESPVGPATELGKSVASRLEAYVREFENRNFDIPLLNFFRDHLIQLYENTRNVDAFLDCLEQVKVVSKFKAAHIKRSADPDIQRCEKIYETVFVRRDVQKLIFAWESSENLNILQLTDDWLRIVGL